MTCFLIYYFFLLLLFLFSLQIFTVTEVRSVMPFSFQNFLTEPSVPLDLNLIEVTNRSLSITWRAPMSPNGASTYYQVFRSNDTNVWATTEKTTVKL